MPTVSDYSQSQQHARSLEDDDNDGTNPETSSIAPEESGATSSSVNNDKKRARSAETEPLQHSAAPLSYATDQELNSIPLPDQQMLLETIDANTRQETLHHVEMAWRAQQRLVRRCLSLCLSSGGSQEGYVYNIDGSDFERQYENTAKSSEA